MKSTANHVSRSGLGCLSVLLLSALAPALAEDWPTYMHDAERSGVSLEGVALPLTELWSCVPPTDPVPAWPDPQVGWGELPKLSFDDAFHVCMVGETVCFGSSVDNGIHALNAATGERRWSFFTGRPCEWRRPSGTVGCTLVRTTAPFTV